MATGDIKLSSNFELNTQKALDARINVLSLADRDNLPFIQRYDRMIVSVQGGNTFQLQLGNVDQDLSNNLNWVVFGDSSLSGIGSILNSAAPKPIPIDSDVFNFLNSETGFSLVKFTWSNIKATLKAYFDTIYTNFVLTKAEIISKLGYTPESTLNRGVANGYVPTDSGNKVPLSFLPSTLLVYKGVWNATTNSPNLVSPDLSKAGFVYNVSVAGTMFGIAFGLGDWAIFNDLGIVEKSDNSDDVVRVNGQQGTVELNTSHIPESLGFRYFNDAQKTEATRNANTSQNGLISASDWNSFNGRMPIIGNVFDLNAIDSSYCMFYSATSPTNAPPNSPYYVQGIQFCYAGNQDYKQQIVITDGVQYFRAQGGGVWGAWQRVATIDNLNSYLLSSGGSMSNTNLVTNLNAQFLNGLSSTSFAREYTANVPNIDDSGYVTIARVYGYSFKSMVRFSMGGTTGSVVVALVADIIVNHSGSIQISSQSGNYTQVTLRILSDSNATYYIQAKTNSVNKGTFKCSVFPYSGEDVEMYTNNPVVSGTASLDHICQVDAVTFSGEIWQGSRLKITKDGQIAWGASADRGVLSWDTGKALIYGQSGMALELGANNTTYFRIGTDGVSTFSGKITSNVSIAENTIFSIVNPSSVGFGAYIGAGSDSRYILQLADYLGLSKFIFHANGNASFVGSLTIPVLYATLIRPSSIGNLHIDPSIGAYATYINYYQGLGGVYFGNGASGSNANVSAAGVFYGANITGTKVNTGDEDKASIEAKLTGQISSHSHASPYAFETNLANIKAPGNPSSLGVLDTIARADHVHPSEFTVKIAYVSLPIWNMVTDPTVEVTWDSTNRDIVGFSAVIKRNTDFFVFPFEYFDAGNIYYNKSTEKFVLTRTSGGTFDNSNFGVTALNRGYISISYINT